MGPLPNASAAFVRDDSHVHSCFDVALVRMPSDSPFISKALKELATRLVRSFVSHISLIRPLSEAGRLRLAHDMTSFEMALTPLSQVPPRPPSLFLSLFIGRRDLVSPTCAAGL